MPRARPITPHRFGPILFGPPLERSWHCSQRAEIFWPAAASAVGSTVPQSGIASSTGAVAAVVGGFLRHAFDDIARLGGLLDFEDRFGAELDDQDEDQRAQNRAGDLVPLEGIHKVCSAVLRDRGRGRARPRIAGDITSPPNCVIAAKRRINQGNPGFSP